MRRLRRFLHRVVLYGLIGLVVNVLVAWGFAAWGGVGSATYVDEVTAPLHWTLPAPDVWSAPSCRYEARSPALRWCGEQRNVPSEDRISYVSRSVQALDCGWPWPALRWVEVTTINGNVLGERERSSVASGVGLRGAIRVAGRMRGSFGPQVQRRLPLSPMWPGMAINAALYGGMLAVAIESARWLRPALRRRRGLCPSCAYDLRGDHARGCPECGWAKDA